MTRQLEDCRTLAEQRGWTIVGEFTDNDISALRGKPRPRYRELIDMVDAGGVDRIIVWHLSRLVRNRRERAEAIEKLAAARVALVAVKGPELDLTTASGRMLAGILGEVDTAESEVKAERVARAALQRAQEGRANGTIPYGWRRQYVTDAQGRITSSYDEEHPEEADIVRGIVRSLLSGVSIREVTKDLNDRGLLSPYGKVWRGSSVRKVALRPGNAALRVHQGAVIGPAAWPALIKLDEHERVTALLSAPERRRSRDGARRHLLSYGIGRCGVCAGILRVITRAGHPMYACDSNRGCVGRRQEWVDQLVTDVVAERLVRSDAAELLVGDDDGAARTAAEVERIRGRLNKAADDYAEDRIDGEQLARITARLRPELEEAAARARAAAPAPAAPFVADLLAAEDVSAAWNELTITQQRTVLTVFGVTVRIMPTRQGPGFNPRSVLVDWPGSPAMVDA